MFIFFFYSTFHTPFTYYYCLNPSKPNPNPPLLCEQAHVVYPRKEVPDNRKAVFETANKYHFLHALALISVPFARKSGLAGGLFITGTVIFSGSCYYYALTDNKSISKYAPYGGMTLILAWLSLAL